MSNNIRINQVPSCPEGIIYTIRAGDTFYSIARAYRIDVYAVMKANPNIDPNRLQIGQQICVPGVGPSPSLCPGGIIYTIRAGDTFYSIARAYRIDRYAIMKANPNVDPNRLQIGQQICVPGVGPSPSLCPGGIIYTIRAGDTFYSIARAYRIDVYAVMKANPNVDPNRLQIGQRICVPGVGTAP